MIDAGLAMVQSLQALAEQTTNKVMRDVIRDVCTRWEGGDSFSEALQKHPKVFTRLYVCMVAAGEKGGLLAEILARLATYLENTARLRKKVKSAMMYPTVVTIVAILITIFLLVKVVPVFGDIFSGFGAKLPGPTLYMIKLSEFVQRYILLLLIGGGAVVYGWFYFIKTKPGREFWDRYRIRMPIFGVIAHKICLARFCAHAGVVDPQRGAHSGGSANRLPNRRQRGHGKGHSFGRRRHRTGRGHLHRHRQTSSVPNHDRPDDHRRRANRGN
jgi:type IV pilus assembly protein PilC